MNWYLHTQVDGHFDRLTSLHSPNFLNFLFAFCWHSKVMRKSENDKMMVLDVVVLQLSASSLLFPQTVLG